MLWLLNRFGIRTIVPMSTIYLFAIIIAIFSTALVNFDFRGGYGYQIMTVTLAFLIAHFINHKQFLEIFSKYLFVLCIISILVFIVANSFSGLLEYFPVHENTAGVQFANLYISGVFIDVGAIRNTGIFREPGVFMIYLLVCILFELYYSTKPNMKHIALYSIAIITTFSTAAILILFFVIAGYILTQKGKGIVKYKAITMVFAFILISIFIFYPNVSFKIFSKLDMDSATYVSFIARQASVIVNYDIFLANPLFGAGLSNYGNLFESYSIYHYGLPLNAAGQSTNSFMSIFATYGFIYGSIIIIAFISLTKSFRNEKLMQIILFLSLLLMFSNEDMRYSLLFNVLVFFGLKVTPKLVQHKTNPADVSGEPHATTIPVLT